MPQADKNSLKQAIRQMLKYIGEDPDRQGLAGTPERVIKSWAEIYGGYGHDCQEVLTATFSEFGKYDEMIVLSGVDFTSMCEHHMLPFYGTVTVAYVPGTVVAGISKLARLVELHARRLQIQERMTSDIAMDLEKYLNPAGVAVVIKAKHFCMTSRGIKKPNVEMITSKLTGIFLTQPQTRQEFFSTYGE